MPEQIAEKNPALSIVLTVVFCLFGFLIFQLLGMVMLMPFSEGFTDLINQLANPFPYPDMKWAIVFMQGMVSLGAFVMAPLFFIWRYDAQQFGKYFDNKNLKNNPSILIVFLVISFMVVNSLFIEWNLNFQFPEFMSGFGAWAREKEDMLERLTQYIISFDSFGYFIFVFVVVAIIPGVGEELLFRGLIQKQLHKLSGNVHMAVWLSAIFFSAFHLQFFGFVPRLLLGVLFGYIYVFSGNLWYPIIAHFVNNGFTLILVYFYQNELIGYDIENVQSAPLAMVGVFFIITSILFYLFYKQVNPENKLINE